MDASVDPGCNSSFVVLPFCLARRGQVCNDLYTCIGFCTLKKLLDLISMSAMYLRTCIYFAFSFSWNLSFTRCFALHAVFDAYSLHNGFQLHDVLVPVVGSRPFDIWYPGSSLCLTCNRCRIRLCLVCEKFWIFDTVAHFVVI